MERKINEFKRTDDLKIYTHVRIWWQRQDGLPAKSWGDCLPQLSITFSLRFQSSMSTQTSGALKAVPGWPQFLNHHGEQAPTFLSGCYLHSSEIGRGANECPCSEGRMANWGENFFIPTVLTYAWEPTEDWIACKQKNMHTVTRIFLEQNLASQRPYTARFRTYKLAFNFTFAQSLLQHRNK